MSNFEILLLSVTIGFYILTLVLYVKGYKDTATTSFVYAILFTIMYIVTLIFLVVTQ